MRTRRAVLVATMLLAACRAEPARTPRAEFVVLAGDSAFWVRSGVANVPRVRGSPIQLARYDGRFYEIYAADDDRSYFDAVLVGQRLYRRDLIAGDSAVVFDDTTIASVARWYAREHPRERPLRPEEEASDDAHVDVSGEVEVLDHFGPYLSFEYRVDGSATGGEEWHAVRRGVVDLRTGQPASLAQLFGDSAATRLLARGAALWGAAVDSVLASRDERAPEAARALSGFTYDSLGFVLVLNGRDPAVEFAAAGHGERAGGLLFALDPLPAPTPPWWREVEAALPLRGSDSLADRWRRGSIDVEARYDSATPTARLVLVDSTRREGPVARVPAPARHLYWLDGAAADRETVRALTRAFDEAALYSGVSRTASALPRTPAAPALAPVAHL
ncbi:MAG: hypothetical protein WKG32_12325, partial [Gemmatimonadaceae bacterium]